MQSIFSKRYFSCYYCQIFPLYIQQYSIISASAFYFIIQQYFHLIFSKSFYLIIWVQKLFKLLSCYCSIVKTGLIYCFCSVLTASYGDLLMIDVPGSSCEIEYWRLGVELSVNIYVNAFKIYALQVEGSLLRNLV